MRPSSGILRAVWRPDVGVDDVARIALALPLLIALDVLVRVMGVQRAQRVVGALFPLRRRRREKLPERDRRLVEFVHALDRAGSLIRPGEMCLRRSLALWCWLRWRGVESEIVLGVRRIETGVVGHAWVEYDSVPVFESAEYIRELVSFGSLTTRRESR